MKKLLVIFFLFLSLKGFSQDHHNGTYRGKDSLILGVNGVSPGILIIRGNTGEVRFKAASATTSYTLTWPGALPGSASLLSIATDGTTSFVAPGIGDPGGNGMLSRTAVGVVVARTITGTGQRVLVTNGTGVSGNPTVDVGTDIPTIASSISVFAAPTGHVSFAGFKLTNMGTPTNDGDGATKLYVDDLLTGIHYEGAVRYATAAALTANTYNNGTLGVGATLTADANGALVVDGQTPSVNDRILVKNEATTTDNGIYIVTAVGSAGAVYVLTRAVDFDESIEIVEGDAVFVLSGGATNALTTWVQNTTGTITVGTTGITFVQINAGAALGADEVLNSNLAEFPANTILLNNTGATANPIYGTATQATAMLNNATTALKGLVPAPGTATGKVLFDNLAWALPTVTSSAITGPTEDWPEAFASLAAKQDLDADLTDIAGETATNNNFMVGVSGQWRSRTVAQVKTTLGYTKADVGLGSVDDVSDANKPVSGPQLTALNLKANLASPTFTGAVVFPTGNIGIPVYARVTGSNFTTTGQTLVNITGLSVALATNATYEVEASLSCAVSAVTTGNGYGINYSVSGGAFEGHITGALTTTAAKNLRLNALNTSSQAWLTSSAQTGGVLIKGIFTTGANAGNLTISTLKVTSGTSTVHVQSYLKVTRILDIWPFLFLGLFKKRKKKDDE